VIATGIKSERMGIKPLPTLSPALRTAQQSVKNMMARKEKLPVQEPQPNTTSEIQEDDLDVPAFIRRRKAEQK